SLGEARKTRFSSVHDCFVRELKPGARPFDPDPAVMASPCDGIVGACGRVENGTVFQAKGFPYLVEDLLGERAEQSRYGTYATIRIRSDMYHRFHAPHDCRVRRITYFSGDTWNVNPIALERVERLFCKNERAAIEVSIGDHDFLLVPVAAILVASIQLHF